MEYQNLTLRVKGMSCEGCERAVENALIKLDGVTFVRASSTDEEVIIYYDSSAVTEIQLRQVVIRAGYQVL
jgi:copper chaperone CopZ